MYIFPLQNISLEPDIMNYKTLDSYYRMLEDAPMAAAILDASSLKLEMANQSMLNLWHRPKSIHGTPLLDFLPELADQEYPKLLKRVIDTGKAYSENGARVLMDRSGKRESVFMDYCYKPISMYGSQTTAVLVMATDVCEREITRLIIQQSRRDLRALVLSAPVPMCIYRGKEFKIEAVNEHMLHLWQGSRKMNLAALRHVACNGTPYTCSEGAITYQYTPLGNGIDSIEGVCVIAVLR